MSRVTEAIYSTVANKCPRCHQGKVFENDNGYNIKNGLKMYTHCPVCHLKYERELGFFQGAMYVSYALQVALFVVVYAADAFFFQMNLNLLVAIIISSIIILFPITFRWSRLLWMNFFINYDKSQISEINN